MISDELELGKSKLQLQGKPIPNEALPVVKLIRELVPRPDSPPFLSKLNLVEQASVTCLRWRTARQVNICPMGMLPFAFSPCPDGGAALSGLASDASVRAFARWWDHQVSPDFAMGQVWDQDLFSTPCKEAKP